LDLFDLEQENALNEVRILASISDPHIIGYKETFYDDEEKCLCIVMEYADGGDLLKKIQKYKRLGEYLPEPLIWKYFTHMLKGLQTLHKMNILHRDIKCANIFLNANGELAQLGDLNVSKVLKTHLART